MSPAERRLTELIEKWLASVEAHFAYLELNDTQYWEARDWPKHERPSRWVLEVARQKLQELKTFFESRQAMGDSRFAEGMELVVFLANLVGLQTIQRYIPLVEGSAETKPAEAPTPPAPTVPAPAAKAAAPNGNDTTIETPRTRTPPPPSTSQAREAPPAPVVDEATREMPRIATPRGGKLDPVPHPHFPERPIPRGDLRKFAKQSDKQSAPAKDAVSPELQNKIVADAVRLMKWGKEWHELPELIARLADRPQAGVIRRLLRPLKTEIETKLAAR